MVVTVRAVELDVAHRAVDFLLELWEIVESIHDRSRHDLYYSGGKILGLALVLVLRRDLLWCLADGSIF